jgi:hypothetical protein
MSDGAEFEERLRQSVIESKNLGYNPTKFMAMLDSMEAVSLAKKLVASGEIQDGMQKIVDLGHPELAMESIMLELGFARLFTEGELEAARWRLDQAINRSQKTRKTK